MPENWRSEAGAVNSGDNLGNWSDVTGATSPYQPNDGFRHVYRLRY